VKGYNAVFKRLSKIFKGFMSLFIKNIETQNPEALLEAQKEELREKNFSIQHKFSKTSWFCRKIRKICC
jgi:hypothetical protein